MSNLQLFFAAGFPTLSVLVGILMAQRSVEKLEKRIDGFGRKEDLTPRIGGSTVSSLG